MESYKSDADNLSSFVGSATGSNSMTVPSEQVPLDHASGVTGTEISAYSEIFSPDSNLHVAHLNVHPYVVDAVNIEQDVDNETTVEINIVIDGEDNVNLNFDDEIAVEVDVVIDGGNNVELVDVLSGENNVELVDVPSGDGNTEPVVVPNDEGNAEAVVVLNDEVNVAADGVPDGEVVAEPNVIPDGEISLEPVNIELVISNILRYMHCSCGQKRTAAEATAEYLANHSHQSRSCFCQVFCLSSSLGEASSRRHVTGQSCPHGVVPANTGRGETSVAVVNSSAQTLIAATEDEHVHDDEEFNLLAAENEILLELLGYLKDTNTGLRIRAFHLSITLHKYETPETSSSESKEHCCICLEDYGDGEEVGKTDCGHVYHVECIKGWLMNHNTCPICNREVLAAYIP